MSRVIAQVDAFTTTAFAGNPAGVCLLADEVPVRWMQDLAAEMNLPAAAFLLEGEDGFQLRWFTPTVEIALCGHATLASAHLLWEEGKVPADRTIRFSTLSGVLSARRDRGLIWLDMPSRATEEAAAPAAVRGALGAVPVWEGRAGHDIVVQLEDEQTVRYLEPEISVLRQVLDHGLIVTARADTAGLDFVSRYFVPGVGSYEDPVTGSAHCALGPYWAKRLGRSELRARQVSRRGGELAVTVQGNRVLLGGNAVTVFLGELR